MRQQVVGARDLPRGAKLRVKLGDIDDITLDLVGTVVERLDSPALDAVARAEAAMDDDEESVAGPIALAVDVGDAEAAAEPPASDNPVS